MTTKFLPAVLVAFLVAGCPTSPPEPADDDTTDDPADDDDTTGDDDDAGDDDVDDDDSAGDDDTTPPPPCDRYNTLGSFTVSRPPDLEAWLRGNVYSGPDPMLLDEIVAEGDCAFFDFEAPPHCDPPCTSPEVCGFGDECRPYPSVLDVGTLTLTGTTPPLQAELGGTVYCVSTSGYPDLYQAGDALTLGATGGSGMDAFQLTVHGVAPLTPSTQSLTMTQHEDMVLTWDPEPVPADARIRVFMSIHHHALFQAYLQCEVDDSAGSLTIPASIVDAFLDASWGGEPMEVEGARMLRLSRAEAWAGLGCVEFASVSQAYLSVNAVAP